MATHSNILAWKIPWTEEPGGLQSMDHQEPDMTEPHTDIHLVCDRLEFQHKPVQYTRPFLLLYTSQFHSNTFID